MRATQIAVLLVSLTAPAYGAPDLTCPVGSRPLLKTLAFTFPGGGVVRSATLICTDGTVLAAQLYGLTSSATLPSAAAITRGKAPSAAMIELRQAMTASRIGFAQDCAFDVPGESQYEERVEWFGAGTRKNVFRIAEGDASLMHCASSTLVFWVTRVELEHSVAFSPTTEVVSFP